MKRTVDNDAHLSERVDIAMRDTVVTIASYSIPSVSG